MNHQDQLTDTQEAILRFIEWYQSENGFSPSVREICHATGLKSTSTVHGYLLRMEKKGLLNRSSMKQRAITVSSSRPEPTLSPAASPSDIIKLPLLGHVAAGVPILAEQNIEEYFAIPAQLVGRGEHYILEVHGDSMIGAGIFDGDYVIVHKQNTASKGEIVVAMLDDEATVKRFFPENGRIRLQPENPTMQPIYSTDVTILGKVVSLYRQF